MYSLCFWKYQPGWLTRWDSRWCFVPIHNELANVTHLTWNPPSKLLFHIQVQIVTCEDATRYFLVPTKYTGSQFFRRIFFGISLVLRNTSPIIITCVSTGLLVHFIQHKKKIRKTKLSEGSAISQSQPREEQLGDLTICLISLAVTFTLFVVPVSTLSFLMYINIVNCTILKMVRWAVALGLLNSSVNFLIYFWKLPLFRKGATQLLRGCSGKEKMSISALTYISWTVCQQ